MDKVSNKDRFAWMPALMPGVAKLMADKRAQLGNAHVAECWKRGMAGEDGWFFAIEGSLAVGTCKDLELLKIFVSLPMPHAAMVWMRNRETVQ